MIDVVFSALFGITGLFAVFSSYNLFRYSRHRLGSGIQTLITAKIVSIILMSGISICIANVLFGLVSTSLVITILYSIFVYTCIDCTLLHVFLSKKKANFLRYGPVIIINGIPKNKYTCKPKYDRNDSGFLNNFEKFL